MITTYDVRWACDVMRPAYDATRPVWTVGSPSRSTRGWPTTPTGRWPRPRRCGGWSTGRTCSSRSRRTDAGLPAITETLAAGISVNVTLIFGLDRYEQVMDAFLAGMEQARANGHDLTGMASVASFFVSRVDTEVDKRLEAIGTEEALAMRGKAAIANAQLAYQRYERVFGERPLAGAGRGRRAAAAAAVGVHLHQEPRLPRRHVRRGARRARRGQHDARGDHPRVRRPRRGQARRGPGRRTRRRRRCSTTWPALGIDYDDVIATLEREGVEKFEASCAGAAQERRDPARDRRVSAANERDRGGGRAGRPGRRTRYPARPRPGRACWRSSAPGLLAEKDPTLWGPAAESEAKIRLGWVDTFRRSRDLLPELLGPAQRPGRARPRRAGRHGRLLAGAGGHHPHPRRRADRAGHHRPAPGPGRAGRPAGAHGRRGGQQVRVHCGDRLPTAGPTGRRSPTPASTDVGRHFVIVTDPGSPLETDRPRDGRPRHPGRPRRRRRLQRADRVRPGAGGAGRGERGRTARPGRGVRPQPRPRRRARTRRWPWAPRWRGRRTAGRDKVALVDDGTGIVGLGDWAEQLIAESTGKEGKGILPVVVETPDRARGDRRRRADGHSAARWPRPTCRAAACGPDVAGQRPARRPVPGLGGGHRAGRRAARHQPVRPAQRGREQGEHRASSSPAGCPSARRRCSSTARSRCYADDARPARRTVDGRPWPGCSAQVEPSGYLAVMAFLDRFGDAAVAGLRPALARGQRPGGDLRLGAAVPALHRPVPQGRPARSARSCRSPARSPTTWTCPAGRTRSASCRRPRRPATGRPWPGAAGRCCGCTSPTGRRASPSSSPRPRRCPAPRREQADDAGAGRTRCATRWTAGCPASRSRARWSSSASPATWPARSCCRPSTTWPTGACCRPASWCSASPAATGATATSSRWPGRRPRPTPAPRGATRCGPGWPGA